jgi:hypothetical protein
MVWHTLGCGGVGLSCFYLYPHHPHLPLDHCFPFELDHYVHLGPFLDFDHVLVWVEWYHLGIDLLVIHLDLMALYQQWSSFARHHKELLHHLQHQDQVAPLGSH